MPESGGDDVRGCRDWGSACVMGVGLEGAKLHVCDDCETIERTRDEYRYGDFSALFQGGGEGYAEAVSFNVLL